MNRPTKTDKILGTVIFLFVVPVSAGCLCSYLAYIVFSSPLIWQTVFLFVPLLILVFYLFGDKIVRKK